MQLRIICSRASGIAKGGTGMTGIAGQYLNNVLEELVLLRDLQINRVTTAFVANAATGYGPYALPADYLRSYDMFYRIPGIDGQSASSQTLFLNPITMEQWDAEFRSPTQTNYPYEYATDLSTDAQVWSGGAQGLGTLTSAGNVFIYPASNGVLTLTHRYMKKQPVYSLPNENASEPWCPYSDYLITATAAKMCRETGDDRWSALREESEQMLRPYLIQEGNEQQTVQNVRLDFRQYRFNRGVKPTKTYPYPG